MLSTQSFENPKLWRTVLIHIGAWLVYITYECTYLYVSGGALKNLPSYVLNYILNISFFYFNAFVLLQHLVVKWKKSWPVVLVLVFAEIVAFVIIKYPINVLIIGFHIQIKTSADIKLYMIANILRSFYFVSFSTVYFLAVLNLRRTQKISELEHQKLVQANEKILLQKDLLQSRNAYLQAQVNPHLLFNTLNFMYNASSKVSEKLAGAVMTLSDIMRYALTNIDEDDRVPLEQEVQHIYNYIRLNQVRYDENLNIQFEQRGNVEGMRIIPLALITIIENVFKYGDLLDPGSPAKILLSVEAGELELTVSNKKIGNRRLKGHGTGIANLRERLEIYYPEAYNIEIDETESSYALKLNLTLNIQEYA